jgi:hypothetical protein
MSPKKKADSNGGGGRAAALKAALTLAGGAIGWAVANHENISQILFREPRIQIVSDDPFVLRNGRFVLTRAGEPTSIAAQDSVPDEPKWFSVPAGAYRLAVYALDDTLMHKALTLARGEKRTIVVPAVSSSTIRVAATNMSPRIGPGGALEFQVESSGNGFVWVLQPDSGSFKLVYPSNCVLDCGNAVTAAKGFHLPDASGRGIVAGPKAGVERLLFLVTSRPDVEYTRELIRRLDSAVVTKASEQPVRENWGYTELAYEVFADGVSRKTP